MAKEAPNSYKDPYWSDLASVAETRAGIPDGLLRSIITNGEKSNADQVSDVGARTPFQITPQTRKAAIEKYGVDPYLSPENAAEVAANLLKDSIDRNNGNVHLAVAEYHGGTNRAAWGPKTRAYVQRVTGGAEISPQDQQAPQSTFQRVMAAQPQVDRQSIANIYNAYKSGVMSQEDAKAFEDDVKAGVIMLPKGGSLAGEKEPLRGTEIPEPVLLPQGVTDAYTSGSMAPEDRAALESDIRAGLVKLPPSLVSQIPTNEPGWTPPTEQGVIVQPVEPSIGEKAIGTGEAALSTATGMTGGLVGMLGGTAKGMAQAVLDGSYGTPQAADMVERAAMKGAQALTYAPRTELGQEYAGDVAHVLEQTIPVVPMGAEMAMLGAGMRTAQPAVSQATRAAAAPIISGAGRAAEMVQSAAPKMVEAIKNAPGRAAEMVGISAPKTAPLSGRASIGAEGLAQDVVRTEKAKNLPVEVNLTRGAATRDAEQLAFEKEMMKNPSLGAPLRARAEENGLQAMQNFDALIDMTGASAPDISATGNKVINALSDGYKAAKNKTNVAYVKAKKSAEANAPVDTNAIVSIGEGDSAIDASLISYLNGKVSGVPSSAVPDTARKLLVKMGMADEGPDGVLIGRPATVSKMEDFRKELSGTAKWDDRPGIREETIIKKLVDAQTEPVAGPLYQEARALRRQQSMKYENRAIVARLITNRKGMDDPTVAVDQVFNRSILNGSPEEITFLKRVLNTSGQDGRQAWKELQGSMVKHIQDEATKGMGMDSADRQMISPAKLHQTVSALDKNGRLDIVLGKKSANIIRDLNDVVRYVNTTPPGTLINNSGTAGTIMAAIAETGINGSLMGIPLPVLSGLKLLRQRIENNKIKAKITRALNAKEDPINKQPQSSGKF